MRAFSGSSCSACVLLLAISCTASAEEKVRIVHRDQITNFFGEPMASDVFFNFFFLMGDANRDARVNLADFNIHAANFGQSGRDFTQGNFNYDAAGLVNLADFNLLASRFGSSVGPDAVGRQPIEDTMDEYEVWEMLNQWSVDVAAGSLVIS